MSNAILNAAAKTIRSTDRIWKDSSAVVRIERRALALDMLPETRAASYPLAWLCETGRLSAETEMALLALSAREFAAAALRIAETGGSVNACALAWRNAAK